MTLNNKLSKNDERQLNQFLDRVQGGAIPNIEALDGFFAALACCPDMIMPSEYMPIIQSGAEEAGDLVFDDMEEAGQFIQLVNRHWKYVNWQLDQDEVYLPLWFEDEEGNVRANHWAQGFLHGTNLRPDLWRDIVEEENEAGAGAMVPIWALAYEHHEDTEMRLFDEPINDKQRVDLVIGAAAGVMWIYRYFLKQRNLYAPLSGKITRADNKTGQHDPCPCDSGRTLKQCCGRRTTLH